MNETLLEADNAEEEETRGNTIRVRCGVPNTNVVCTVIIPDPCNQGAVEPANPPPVAVTGNYTKQKKRKLIFSNISKNTYPMKKEILYQINQCSISRSLV